MRIAVIISVFLACGIAQAETTYRYNNVYNTTHIDESKRCNYEPMDYGVKAELPLYVWENGAEVRVDPEHLIESEETRVYATVRIPLNKVWQK